MKIDIKRLLRSSLLMAALLPMLGACNHQDSEKPSLAVTIAPQKYLLERIVGDKYDIVTLLSASADPETYDPAVSSLMGLQKSEIFFRVGTLGFEQASLGKIAEASPDLKIVNCSVGIPLSEGTHGGPNGYDPHVWTSVRNARVMAKNMYEALVQLHPKEKEYFRHRYELLDRDLASMDSTISVMLAPSKGESFVIRHPSLTYFAKDYGLRQVSLELNGKEPTPAQMRHRLDEVRDSKAALFFIEKGHASDATRNIATSLNLPVTEISLLDYDWKENMLNVARAVAETAPDSARSGK